MFGLHRGRQRTDVNPQVIPEARELEQGLGLLNEWIKDEADEALNWALTLYRSL